MAYKKAMEGLADSAWAAGLTSRRAGKQRAEGPGGEDGDGAGSSSDPPTAAAGSSSDHAADAATFFEERRRLDAYLRNLTPVSSMNDRAPNGRAAARLGLTLDVLIDVMIADGGTVPGRTDVATGTELYLVLWKNFPVEIATWEVSFRLRAAARASGHAC